MVVNHPSNMAELRVPNDQFLSPNKSRLPDVIVVPDSSSSLEPRHIHQHLTPPSPHLAYSSSTSPSPTSPTPSIPSNVLLSPDNIDTLTRRSNSTVSSIFDLSFESDQLERALKENDVNAVTKFLHIHHGKFPLKPSHAFSTGIGGRHYDTSASSGSRRPSSRSHELDMPFRRFTLERIDFDRRESVTPEWDIPDIFRSSIHVAISNNSLDVILVLLKSGIDPNEPSINLINYDSSRGYGHHDTDRRHQPEIVPEETDELSNVQVTSGNGLEIPVFHHSPHHARLDVSKTKFHYLHVAPPDKHHMTLNEHGNLSKIITYSSEDLLKLPPLYIAVVEKKAMVIDLLLMHGAEATVQDRNGSTPLHLAASPEHFDVECCKALLRYGAKIKVKHHNGVSPYDQRPELAELQISEVQNVLSGKCTAFSLDRWQGTSKSGGKRISLSSNSDSNSRSFGRTGSLKRLFKREKGNSEGKEKDKKRTRCESTTTEYNLDLKDYGSSASSHRSSRSRLHSTAVTEADENEVILIVPFLFQDPANNEKTIISSSGKGLSHKMSLRRGEKSKHRNSYAPDQQDKSSFEETERSLRALIQLAGNTECISSLVDGLGNYIRLVLALTEQADCPNVERAINELFNTIIQTVYDQLKDACSYDERVNFFVDLSRLLNITFELLRGKQSLHFTALMTINRIIDICVIHRNHEITFLAKSTELNTSRNSSPKRKGSHSASMEENSTLSWNRHFSFTRKERRQSHEAHSKEPHDKHEHEENKNSNICTQVHRTPLEILTSMDPGQILSTLHNNITMHKRIIGTRQKCTPSTRCRQCTHHCLQILSARVLSVMCHGPTVQLKIVEDGHIKTLVEALDPNHDPHLLCLLLQSLSSIALNPNYHQVLSDADIEDMLMQLLLPSDEWYNTNHSTKYAKFVKYHAARILVYMGQLHRLGGRVDLFDRKSIAYFSRIIIQYR